ncbi:ferredoxin [Kitasatospora sp. NPDC050543]|uniref:ferredoxin n=1 Tax=Kitasatospora sp. NPDC050543 TaxID=3364054 RepID=UPI0037B4AFC6
MTPARALLRVDRIACAGHGQCAELLPELISLDEWGYPVLHDTAVPPDCTRTPGAPSAPAPDSHSTPAEPRPDRLATCRLGHPPRLDSRVRPPAGTPRMTFDDPTGAFD